MRPDNAAAQLLDRHSDNAAAQLADAQSECKECADAQSGRKEAAEGVKRVSGDTPDPGRELRPCTPYVKIALVRHTVE
jgi:hypothetical protein